MLKKSPWALVLIVVFPFAVMDAIVKGWQGDGVLPAMRDMWREYRWFWRELVDEE